MASLQSTQIQQQDIGIMGTGSNMFRCGILHSSGKVFVGTYGPQPAIVWQYDPAADSLEKVGAPGEYQLDCMVEAPNGKIYIGTAYEGRVYELDPESGSIRDLGSPPVDSTPWIFTMICTSAGEIFGARGVGLFHLDWRTGKMESCGIVPGDHRAHGISSAPITRTLEERPDGVIWGDTNRWIFTFDPRTRVITPIADVAATDEACYAVIHGLGQSPVMDLYFQVYARFTGLIPKHKFFVCRAATGEIEPLDIAGLEGFTWVNGWWTGSDTPRWLVTHHASNEEKPTIAVVDVERLEVVERWTVDTNDRPPARIPGAEPWFISLSRGTLYRADEANKQLNAVATNPMPTECRCLAVSPDGRLGTDTYDCGFAFTRRIDSEQFVDHGPVWVDDHRCNYGPAAFAGEQGRYFLANHGEAEEIAALWVTDTQTNRHWRAGGPVVQLVRFREGSVWGTHGDSIPWIDFVPEKCWTPAWITRPGGLFRYEAGAETIEIFEEIDLAGPLAEAPTGSGQLIFANDSKLHLLDIASRRIVDEAEMPAAVTAIVTDYNREESLVVLNDGAVWSCQLSEDGRLSLRERATGFGEVGRGCFLLPQSGRLVGIASDGTVSAFDRADDSVRSYMGEVPLFAGPAVDPTEDAWYFVDRQVRKYTLPVG